MIEIDIPCGHGKKLQPYRCEFVPKERYYEFFERYPKLCHYVLWECYMGWLIEGIKIEKKHPNLISRRAAFNRSSKKWWNNPLSMQLEEIIQRELNYMPNTVSYGHIRTRAARLYRMKYGYNWVWNYEHLSFYHNNVLVQRVKRH